MRTITSDDGRLWDVAVREASYGAQYLLFAARSGNEVRQVVMLASTRLDAERELAGLSDDQLRNQLVKLDASDADDPINHQI